MGCAQLGGPRWHWEVSEQLVGLWHSGKFYIPTQPSINMYPSFLLCCCDKTKSNFGKEVFISPYTFRSQFVIKESQAIKSRCSNQERWRDTACRLTPRPTHCSFSCTAETQLPRDGATHNRLGPTHLSWGILFPGDSVLCHVDNKNEPSLHAKRLCSFWLLCSTQLLMKRVGSYSCHFISYNHFMRMGLTLPLYKCEVG